MESWLLPFASNLKKLREEANLSLRELGEEIGISKSALHQYENAIADPSLTALKKIVDYFEVDINWLIGETPIRGVKKSVS